MQKTKKDLKINFRHTRNNKRVLGIKETLLIRLKFLWSKKGLHEKYRIHTSMHIQKICTCIKKKNHQQR